ncbi:MarR family winged helix-turn-helix transcriptional regulator [Glutamicibacter halophytocola]|uniref:MarR family transcriptional regulator n=1 Tax=Glutamicibacter halophytocola TaxID=1933880 RepID=A0AA94XW67_9MICC|nr:MarR family transcriptional regulator [Glutamicibacter halophytocola]ALG27717.1 MarR family transcriptional regulator [Glutamicibacter halophytocola]UUX59267.1 MarR family transcriptional regulator [Glutamicibacter halophytocola]
MTSPLPRDPIAQAREQWISHGWTAQADSMAAITAVMRTASIFLQRADAILKPHGLTFARFEVLALLGFSKRGSLPMSQASDLLQVHATSLTNSVDRLESTGLVRRIAHPTDGRTRLLELTTQGQKVLGAARDDLNEQLFAQSKLSGMDAIELFEILARFRKASGDFL